MRIASLGLAVLAVAAFATPARAHFTLTMPQSWDNQDGFGNPQKAAPCGNEGTPVATDAITGYMVGATITIAIDRTIAHPGHYRVSLAADQASLPADPP